MFDDGERTPPGPAAQPGPGRGRRGLDDGERAPSEAGATAKGVQDVRERAARRLSQDLGY